MNRARPVSIADVTGRASLSDAALAALLRADPEALPDLLANLSQSQRARLAVHLYGRSHTHELGVRIAATCDEAALDRVAGTVGHALYDLSRRPYAAPSYGNTRPGNRRVSLGGSGAPRLDAVA